MAFTTGRASYEAGRSLIVTDDRVVFTDGGMSVTGVGMEFSAKNRQVRVLKDVTATVMPRKKG
jgi:lipopolysaccharide export system protein LptC